MPIWPQVNHRSHEAEPNSIIYPRSDEVIRGITIIITFLINTNVYFKAFYIANPTRNKIVVNFYNYCMLLILLSYMLKYCVPHNGVYLDMPDLDGKQIQT